MSELAASEPSLKSVLDDVFPETRDEHQALSIGGSVVLHGVLLGLLLLSIPLGMGGSQGRLLLVPVEMISPVEATARSTAQKPNGGHHDDGGTAQTSSLQGNEAGGRTVPATNEPSAEQRRALSSPPRLEIVLPNVAVTDDEGGATAASDDAAPGRLSALEDAIRGQVERHWSFDRAHLVSGDYSVPIELFVTDRGEIVKANILDTGRPEDPVYHDLALSARSAALLASPLSMPHGTYERVTRIVLSLNPRDAMQ